MAAMARLNRIWWCNTISFTNKCKLYKPLITSILLCGCETWTLPADSEEKNQALETKCLKKLLHVSYLERKPLTGYGARATSLWANMNLFWRLSRDGNSHSLGNIALHNSLSKTLLQGTLEGGRC